ncbi:MAG: SGNH/GDSL hydrolase family protein [Pirellulales bacterium]|nr:SGNH/GDSL hydrolase family protein [Pirellulales bacterium]
MSETVGDLVVLALIALAPVVLFVASCAAVRYYRRSQGGRRRWAWLAGQLFITLFLLSLILAGAELYYRFFYDETDVLDMSKASKRWHARHYQFNNLGFRDNVDYANRPQPGRWRVTVLGDSFTAAAGVPQVEDRFVNRLRAMHPTDWEIHSFGENGANTGREWYLLQTALIKGYRTNFVLVAYCPNDISDLMPGWDQVGLRIKQRYDELPFLARHSYFLNTFLSRRIAATDPDAASYYPQIAKAYDSDLWRTHKERLQGLQQYCLQRGMGFAIVLFPFLHDLEDPAFARIQDQLRTELAFAPVLDLRPLFLQQPSEHWVVNAHDAHPNEAAHAVAAQAIEQFLRELWLPASGMAPTP